MEITPENLKKAISARHQNYEQTINEAEKLKVHAEGRVPEKLINERRPSEPENIKDYRKKIYVPKTQNPINKVLNSLEKIRRSQDWVISYNPDAVPAKIAEVETLEQYCEINYPIHTSLTNWMFAEGLQNYLLDANGVFAVLPYEMPASSGDYVKPYVVYFDSKSVLDFVDGDYAILRSNDKSTFTSPAGRNTYTNGEVYIVLTDTQYLRLEQTDINRSFAVTEEYSHNIGVLPAFRAGGKFWKRENGATLYKSRISSMIPSLDEAAREYSDLQAEIVQHIHSEKYAYTNTECPTCKGTCKTFKDGKEETCQVCGGAGSILNVSPYGMHLITTGRKMEEYQLPTPPIGYVQKGTEIAKLQDERVRQHIYDALSTLNMEFLAETPLNQSGVAKQVDKDELNNFVNSIAEDIVRIMDDVYYFINEYRYIGILPDKTKREMMLPGVNVPTQYEILSSTYLIDEIKTAKDSGIHPSIRRALEIDYAKKKFYTQLSVSYEAELCFELDPLYGVTEDEKMTRKANGGVTDTDYIISCNILQFIQRAMDEDADFYRRNLSEKQAKIKAFAEEKKKEIETVTIDMNTGL